MRDKLKNLWHLTKGFELMDANNDFFMVNFDIEEDKMKVTLGGS